MTVRRIEVYPTSLSADVAAAPKHVVSWEVREAGRRAIAAGTCKCPPPRRRVALTRLQISTSLRYRCNPPSGHLHARRIRQFASSTTHSATTMSTRGCAPSPSRSSPTTVPAWTLARTLNSCTRPRWSTSQSACRPTRSPCLRSHAPRRCCTPTCSACRPRTPCPRARTTSSSGTRRTGACCGAAGRPGSTLPQMSRGT